MTAAWKLAPTEPTLEMLDKGRRSTCVEPTPTECARIYRAMLADAPDLNLREVVLALIELRKQCREVRPFANAVATEARIPDIRRVGAFMKACERADAALAALAKLPGGAA